MPSLDAVFSALSDPTRRAILGRLTQGEATVRELAEPFEISQPAVSRHLKVLEDAGLITQLVDGTRRPRRFRPGSLDSVEAWLTMMREALAANYRRLDGLLDELPTESRP